MNPAVTLRLPEPGDLDVLYRWENDPTQWHNQLTVPLTSRHMLWAWLRDYTPGTDQGIRLMVEADGSTVGTVDLADCSARNGTAFVSIYIDAAHRGRGIATAALARAITLAADGYGLERLAALVAADNAASLRLFTSAGFTRPGPLPSWLRPPSGRTDLRLLTR